MAAVPLPLAVLCMGRRTGITPCSVSDSVVVQIRLASIWRGMISIALSLPRPQANDDRPRLRGDLQDILEITC